MKNKKKSVSKKTWMVDCRTDGAYNFAIKQVLPNALKDEFSKEKKLEFVQIAYSNLKEIVAKAQTDPREYKLPTVMKLFQNGLKEITKVMHKLGYGDDIKYRFSNPEDLVMRARLWHVEFLMIRNNPFDLPDINYPDIEIAAKRTDAWSAYNEKLVRIYEYPKIYETINEWGFFAAELLPTNEVRITIPKVFFDAWEDNNKFLELHKNAEELLMDQPLINPKNLHLFTQTELIRTDICGLGPILDLIKTFVNDSRTTEIGITAYRLGEDNPIINELVNATKKGIKCKVYLELTARGETIRNLRYLQRLCLGGDLDNLEVRFRYNDIKVHGKMMYIDYSEGAETKTVGIFSTGNYNFDTATIYKDYHLISSSDDVTSMIKHNFDMIWNNQQPVLSSISNIVIKEIYAEIAKGSKGRIWIQTNHLDNKLIVDLLKEAVKRGCDVKMIVRTTKGFHNNEFKCCKTVTGKYLEHARVYIFGNNVYLSSSDLLFRNLYNRFESYVLITAPCIRDQLQNDFKNLYKNGQKTN